jgi:hypothetical protein
MLLRLEVFHSELRRRSTLASGESALLSDSGHRVPAVPAIRLVSPR